MKNHKWFMRVGVMGASLGGAVIAYAASDTNGDGFLDFTSGGVITAADINTNFQKAGTHIKAFESAFTVTSGHKVGIGGSPINDESLYIFQDGTGTGGHLNLRLHKSDGGDMFQLIDENGFYFTSGLDSVNSSAYMGVYPNTDTLVFQGDRIGIGRASPQASLDVAGDIRATAICDENGAMCVDLSTGWGTPSQWTTSGSGIYYKGGNVGIGTSNPHSKLGVVGSYDGTIASSGMSVTEYSNSVAGAVFLARKARGTEASPAAVQVNDRLLSIYAHGYHSGGDFSSLVSGIQVFAAENFTSTAQGTYMTLETTAIGTKVKSERLRIDPAGLVGIGTSAPARSLDVNGPARVKYNFDLATGTAQVGFNRDTTNGSIYDATHNAWQLGPRTSSDDGFIFSSYNTSGAYTASPLYLSTTGKVGVRAINPRADLDVGAYIDNGALRTVFARQSEGDSSGDGTFLGVRAYETQFISYAGKMFSIEQYFHGQINSAINFYRGGSTTGGFMTFMTTDGTERMRIDGGGNVGIGTTSPGYLLHVNGTMAATSYVTTSDLRLKKDIQPLDNALERVQCLVGVQYRLKDPANARPQVGFLAQEVEQCFPEVVYTDARGYKGVAYAQLVAPLVEAVKDQQLQIEGLEARDVRRGQETTELRRQLAETNARLAQLEALVKGRR